jgi:PhzF family phenazine biosynthesis protein
MDLKIYHVDAFTDRLFAGNPACVVPLEAWLPDELHRAIAAENGVPETAFFVPEGAGFRLRWFTPDLEMDLCGHATLATAHVILEHLGGRAPLVFQSASGELRVERETAGGKVRYVLDFPRRPPLPAVLPREIAESLNIAPRSVHKARDYILEYASEAEVLALAPDRRLMERINLDPGGVVATAPGAPGSGVDFVSRFFTPQATIFEDPVTGSAHCSLVPFWVGRLGKRDFVARQVSARGGTLYCRDKADRVRIAGEARTYARGTISVEGPR